jgi:hypothetical protein
LEFAAAALLTKTWEGPENLAAWAISEGAGYLSYDMVSRLCDTRWTLSNEKPENNERSAPDLSEDMKQILWVLGVPNALLGTLLHPILVTT